MASQDLILDRYELLGTAGAGGFGTVRIAWDPRIQRKVAIKTIELSEIDAYRAGLPGADAVAGAVPHGAGATRDRWHGLQPWDEFLEEDERDASARGAPDASSAGDIDSAEHAGVEPVTALAHLPGLDEARTAARLQDSRIVGVYDFEVRGRVAYLIMEYIEGITLTELLADYEDWLTLDVVAAVFDAVAGALSVAHEAGVLHLDIKPDNIIINTSGQAKVTDFGLATLADASGTGTAGGGTIGYMPLEQMRREPLDARSDEWALASVLYEMLTGENEFRAHDLTGAEKAIENAELVLPSLCWDDIGEQIDDVVFYALDPDREKRYDSVRDFAEEADKFLGDAKVGRRELASLVSRAVSGEDDDWEDEEEAGDMRRVRPAVPGFMKRAGEALASFGYWPQVITRGVAAFIVGRLMFAGVESLYPTMPLFGRDAGFTTALACGLVIGALGAIWPHWGLLVAGVIAGFSFIVAGQVVAGSALAVVSLVWYYVFVRLASQRRRPVLLVVMAIALVALLVAVAVLVRIPQEFTMQPVLVIVAIVASSAVGLLRAER